MMSDVEAPGSPEVIETRVEAAAEALVMEEDAPSLEPETEAEAEPETEAETEPETEAEVEPETEAEAEQVAEEPEPPDWKWAQFRRKERQLLERVTAIEDSASKLEARTKELSSRETQVGKLWELARRDPEAFIKESGGDPDKTYEQWTRHRLDDGERGTDHLLDRVDQLEAQLRERDEAQLANRKRHEDGVRNNTYVKAVNQYVDGALAIPSNEKLSSEYPNLALLPPSVLGSKAQNSIEWAMRNRPDVTWDQCMKALDEVVGEELEYIYSQKTQGSGNPAEDREAKAPNKKPATKSRTLNNNHQAVSSRKGKPLTREERIAAAAEVMPDNLF